MQRRRREKGQHHHQLSFDNESFCACGRDHLCASVPPSQFHVATRLRKTWNGSAACLEPYRASGGAEAQRGLIPSMHWVT